MEVKKLTVRGKVGDKVIEKIIVPYQSNIPEQVLTVKRDICDTFKCDGYNPNDVIFQIE
ncbi:hypothetical protein [Prevotella intermedia]|jgi:hypothetical protein|uniref:hypothetical protein n=1 Tax=Prevotella intermedia TaxID=28131 RepID=UPI000A858B79|nr:hypothetical protein [Prevotella intermedia]